MTDQPSALRQSHFASGWDAGRAKLEAENERLRKALEEAAVILEALHAAVQWELAPEIRGHIAVALPTIREALKLHV